MNDLVELQEKLGVRFSDLSLLEQALRHSSYVNETALCAASNEKLEFLGDAVLGLAIAERIYQEHPEFSEGEMTRLRAAVVRQDTLARIARALRVGDYLYLGRGEEASSGRSKPTNLASALEAIIAAVFLDQGFDIAGDLVRRLLGGELAKAVKQGAVEDYKSQLQELIQARHQVVPTYHLVEAAGPSHSRTFTVEVRVGDELLGCGTGKSKKLAETEAARLALGRLSATFTP